MWNHYKDEVIDDVKQKTASKSFEYKTKVIGKTTAIEIRLDTEVVVSLKYLSNFWRYLDLSLLMWKRAWFIKNKILRTLEIPANQGANPPTDRVPPTPITFKINSTTFSVPVVILSINNNIKFLKNIKQAFKTTISWNKYRSQVATQPKNNNLDYITDPTFKNVNRLFNLSFNGEDDPTRDSFDKYCMSLAETRDFNALIDNKLFFDKPVKNKQETYKKLVEMSRNNDYATRNFFGYSYHQNYCKLIGIDLSR